MKKEAFDTQYSDDGLRIEITVGLTQTSDSTKYGGKHALHRGASGQELHCTLYCEKVFSV